MITDLPDLPYRPCVGIILLNEKNLVFVGERIDTPGAWQMPQGGIDEGEDISTAALRELREEIGTDKARILHIAEQKLRYDLPEPTRTRLWNGAFRGQEQTWVAARFTGQEADINLKAHTPPEFSNWQWIPLEQTPSLIVPFKRKTYEELIDLFKNFFNSSAVSS